MKALLKAISKSISLSLISMLLTGFCLMVIPVLAEDENRSPDAVPTEISDEPLFDNQEARLHYQEGVQWYQKKSYEKAINALEKAVEANPEYKEAYYLLGYAYYEKGKMDLSREAFNQAYELDPLYSPLPPPAAK
ncbi:MAG: tetratricopeptide repeat protein [Nitrospirae bacterium]|nr:tetratricopeptide repeat protein [Nitrospirota bacterium]MBI3594008.1 tetratricopeptide repeat protein [Nitrospirota bacterium]